MVAGGVKLRWCLNPHPSHTRPSSYPSTAKRWHFVVFRQYHSANAAIPAFFREEDEGKLATVVEAESEAILHTTHDLREIASKLRRSRERGKALEHDLLQKAVASLPYPERRVLQLCDNPDGQSLTEAEAAAEIGCSVRTVRRLRQRGGAKVLSRLGQELRRNAD